MRRDDAYLLDMLIAARDAVTFVAELTFDQFQDSRMHQLAVLKALETLGEAAGRLSKDTRATHSEIPPEIIGMRNRLIHGYFEVDLEKVWDTVHKDLGSLISNLEILVGQAVVRELINGNEHLYIHLTSTFGNEPFYGKLGFRRHKTAMAKYPIDSAYLE